MRRAWEGNRGQVSAERRRGCELSLKTPFDSALGRAQLCTSVSTHITARVWTVWLSRPRALELFPETVDRQFNSLIEQDLD
jgi:hypothetical protein